MDQPNVNGGSSFGSPRQTTPPSARETVAEELRAAGRIAADKLESSAKYVQSQMMPDFLAFVRRHPAPTLLVVGGVGLLLGLVLRRD